MSLEQTINNDIKEAMKAKEKVSLESLRAIKSALLLLKTDSEGKEITEEDELKLLQKLAKQRKDSASIYAQKGRKDLETAEVEQLKIIEKYLPKPLSEQEVIVILDKIITDCGATSLKDLGRVMGQATKTLAGKTDGKLIASIVKSKLN